LPLPLLRPFADWLPGRAGSGAVDRAETAATAAMPLLPCPAAFAPAVLLFREEGMARRAGGAIVPPLLLAAAARSLAELDRFARDYGEALWKRTDRRLSPWFERSGPWLYARHGAAGHEAFFRSALGAGVLVSPDCGLPSLVPGDFDDGELAALAAALARPPVTGAGPG